MDAQPGPAADPTRSDQALRVVLDGSVALHCLLHARGPVLVVRPAARQSAPRSTLVDSASR